MIKETSALGLTDQHDSTQNRHEGEDDSEAKIAMEIDLEVDKDFDGGSSESIREGVDGYLGFQLENGKPKVMEKETNQRDKKEVLNEK